MTTETTFPAVLIDSGRAEARALASGVADLRRTPEGRRRLWAQAAEVVVHCVEYPILMRRRWEQLEKDAEGAAWAADELDPYIESVLDLADNYLRGIEAVRQGLEESEEFRHGPGEGAAPDLPALDAAADALREIRLEIASLLDWLKAPPPPRKLRTTAEIRAGRERGEYVSLDDLPTEAPG